jgi:hypothetical protein
MDGSVPDLEKSLSRFIDGIPIWLVFLVTVFLCLLLLVLSYRFGRSEKSRLEGESQTPIRNMVSATLALQTLLLAFTFSSAGSHYSERSKARSEEADAFRVLWLRTFDLPDAKGAEGRALLREVFEARYELIKTGSSETSPRSLAARRKLLIFGMLLLKKNPDSNPARNFDAAIDKYPGIMARVTTGSRIAPFVWVSVFFLSLLSMIPLGYHAGLMRSLPLPMTLPLVVSFSLVLALISAVDNPTKGLIGESKAALEDLHRIIYEEIPELPDLSDSP